MQDADEAAIHAGASGWCAFAKELAKLLSPKAWIEVPLVHILARLNAIIAAINVSQRLALNTAGNSVLAHYLNKEDASGEHFTVKVAIETMCHTFNTAPMESEHTLLSLLAPERLLKYPHRNLYDLATDLKYLGPNGRTVVIRSFDAAFATEPMKGHWEDQSSVIAPMCFQTSDLWNLIHKALAAYYETHSGEDVALATEATCLAWNAVVRRRRDRRDSEESILTTIQFRGVQCDLIVDYSHIWSREFEPEESRILSHFEKLLRAWAATGDTHRLNTALDYFAIRNRTALLWSVFMEAGAEYPTTLGVLLADVLNESIFLTHPDYAYSGAVLLGALHEKGNITQRERLEKLILDLPKNARLNKDEARAPRPSWVTHAQNRLLAVLNEHNIVLDTLRDVWRERQAAKSLPPLHSPRGPMVISHTLTEEELSAGKGYQPKGTR